MPLHFDRRNHGVFKTSWKYQKSFWFNLSMDFPRLMIFVPRFVTGKKIWSWKWFMFMSLKFLKLHLTLVQKDMLKNVHHFLSLPYPAEIWTLYPPIHQTSLKHNKFIPIPLLSFLFLRSDTFCLSVTCFYFNFMIQWFFMEHLIK